MDPIAPASFIPKRSLEPAPSGGVGLFFLLSLLFFMISVVAAGAAFAYQGYLSSSIDSKKTSLQRSEGAYDLPVIQDLVRIDSRLGQAKVLLQRHTAPSAVFDILSQLTLARVQLTSFDYALQSDGSAQLRLAGVGDSFSTVALQSDQFGSSRVLHDIVFSGVTVDQGGVSFSVTATVDPAAISYAKSLVASAALTLPAPEGAAPTTNSTSSPQTTP